jgi:Rrf2 family transcriptional regulator, nitric oxide-sensitive transcriptional repressor
MRLTTFSDYTLRTLTYLALHPNRFITIAEIATAYGISGNHLMKVVQTLAGSGDVITLRGPRGGLRLSRPASEIKLGDVIRRTEPDAALTSCFGTPDNCVVQPACVMTCILHEALAAFMAVLDSHSLADLVVRPSTLKGLLDQNMTSDQSRKLVVNGAGE